MRYIKLTHVGFRAHVKTASRIISYSLDLELQSIRCVSVCSCRNFRTEVSYRGVRTNTQLEGKYSLESTDPRESEIRAPPHPLSYLMPIPPTRFFITNSTY